MAKVDKKPNLLRYIVGGLECRVTLPIVGMQSNANIQQRITLNYYYKLHVNLYHKQKE